MSKKHNKPQPEVQPQPAAPAPAPLQEQPDSAPATKKQIWTFWGAVVAVLVVARVLDIALPNVQERVIERWLMVAFAAFLVVFLVKLKK